MIIAALAALPIAMSFQASPTLERMELKIPGQLPSLWLRKIPSGTIRAGGKAIEVKSFWISETEITWDVYDVFAFRLDLSAEQNAQGIDATARPSKPYGAPDRGFGHNGYAALGMTANGAQKFCEWLKAKTGKNCRLPTTIEWEYAARAGDSEEPKNLADVAWFWDNAEDKAHPVGKLKPNAWGLFDMLGNVQEWALDSESKPTTCGGSYRDKAERIRFSARVPYDSSWQEADAHVPKSKWWLSDGPFVGMRLVIEP